MTSLAYISLSCVYIVICVPCEEYTRDSVLYRVFNVMLVISSNIDSIINYLWSCHPQPIPITFIINSLLMYFVERILDICIRKRWKTFQINVMYRYGHLLWRRV